MSLIAIILSLLTAQISQASETSQTELNYPLLAKLHERLTNGESANSLEDAIPKLARNLEIARGVSEKHWAESTPVDELAKARILSDQVLDALGIAHQTTNGVTHVPAGTMHSYGYLFSQVRTAYGLKGKRWVESRLDERLGLPAELFTPFAKDGEFLSNLTYALSRSIPGYPAIKLENAASSLKKQVKKSAKLYLGCVEEHVEWRATKQLPARQAAIRTHLFTLNALKDFASADTHLLVYEIELDGIRRFVTAFPIDSAYADAFLATKPANGNSFKPRFNLYIEPNWSVSSYKNLGFKPTH